MRHIIVLGVVAFVLGCSGSNEKRDAAIFDATYRTATELKAGQEVGMNREKFRGLLQQFATDISVAKDKAKSGEEKRICDGYSAVLEIYEDAARVWDVKISIPRLKARADDYIHNVAIPRGDTGEFTKELDFERAVIFGIPLNVYPEGGTGIDDVVSKYKIPVTDHRGYKTIPEDSIQFIWAEAREKNDDVDKLRKGK